MRKYMIFVTALTFGATTAACAGSSDSSMSFNELDANGNGKVSMDEFHGSVSDMGVYSDFDANNDDQLSEDEWNAIGWDYDYDAWDANADGYVGSDEFYDGWYDTYDENDDGIWNENEYNVYYDDADEWGVFDV